VAIKILIADDSAAIPMLANALAGYDLLTASKLLEAERLLLEDGIAIFVIGIHFDDSHAMELVNFIRNNPKHGQTPIVMVRLLAARNAKMLRNTLDAMKSTQGINEYLEFEASEMSSAGAKIRAAVECCLPQELVKSINP